MFWVHDTWPDRHPIPQLNPADGVSTRRLWHKLEITQMYVFKLLSHQLMQRCRLLTIYVSLGKNWIGVANRRYYWCIVMNTVSQEVFSTFSKNSSKHFWQQLTFWHNMAFSVVLARVRCTANPASPAWRDCRNKDEVSHQWPPAAVGQRRISTVWSLGAHFKDLHPLGGGAEWACWARLPGGEGPRVRLTDPQWLPPTGVENGSSSRDCFFFFFLRRALWGWAGWGQVWGSSWRGA